MPEIGYLGSKSKAILMHPTSPAVRLLLSLSCAMLAAGIFPRRRQRLHARQPVVRRPIESVGARGRRHLGAVSFLSHDEERVLRASLSRATPDRCRADARTPWEGVCLARIVVGCASPKRTLLRVRLARSCRRVRKLWTGWPSSVHLRAALRGAAGETLALATGDERCAAAAAGSSVSAKRIDILLSNHNGVSARR